MRNDAVGFFWDDTPPPKPPKKEKEKRTPPEPVWLEPDYLPGLDEALEFPVEIMTIEDLKEARIKQDEFVNDVEVYQNYFLSVFKNIRTNKVIYFEMTEDIKLDITSFKWMLESFTIITFNGIKYDLVMNDLALAGCTCGEIKEASDGVILYDERGYNLRRKYKAKKTKVDHIDLIEVAPLYASLKAYAGRLHAKKMQDLPFHPATILSKEQIAITRYYCVNDTDNTQLLRECLDEQIELRYKLSNEYQIDLRSKSDAQIAETVIGHELKKLSGIKPEKPTIEPGTLYKYQTPAFMQFQSPVMQWALKVIQSANFIVDVGGSIAMPEEIKDLQIDINGSIYRMGIGGLHSSESSVAHKTDENYILIDKDVTSYYPYIILNLGLFPKHLGAVFLQVYKGIVNRRIKAKQEKNKVVADSLKIVVNGSYGKLGNKYSILYSPNLLIQVTITGQLALLLLIERLELAGIRVVSANTDGIVIKCHRTMVNLLNSIVEQWEKDTGFPTEETRYLALYSRDVNNYIAIKQNETDKGWEETFSGTKNKGAFANPWSDNKNKAFQLHKNPTTVICVEAVEKYLVENIPIDHTIMNCRDLSKFVTVRNVRGGAVKVWEEAPPEHENEIDLIKQAGFTEIAKDAWVLEGEGYREARYAHQAYPLAVKMLTGPGKTDYIGKVVRWYYAKDVKGELVYASSGNKVPKSDGALPCMVFPDEFPTDIDYEWYINEAVGILRNIGAIAPQEETV